MAIRLAVRVTPRGGRDAVEGWALDAAGRPVLKLRVAAAAADGAANAAVLALLAAALGAPKSSLSIAAGHTARVKLIAAEGATAADLARVFGPPPA